MPIDSPLLNIINLSGRKNAQTKSSAPKSSAQRHNQSSESAQPGYIYPARKAKHLIGLLKIHGARNRRLSMPRTTVRLSVYSTTGTPSIRISL